MGAKVTWKEKLSFTGTADSGFTVPLGTDPSVGGSNDGFRPMELLAVSLAACTGMDVISILQKKRQDVTAFEVRVKDQRADEHPKVYQHIILEYVVEGRSVDPGAVERAIELSSTKYCAVQNSLSPEIKIEHKYQIIDISATIPQAS